MAKRMLRKGLQRLQPLQRKLAAEKQDIYSGSALLGALKLVVIATDVPSQPRDQRLTSMLREEGFSVTWLPPITSAHRFVSEIERVDDELERSDQYAVVAFRRAATFALDCFRRPAWPNLRAVVAYYPSRLPRSDGDGGELTFDPKFHVKVHLARTQPPPSEFRGSGAYFYVYPFSDVGFAEDHHAAFDPIDARLAWSRTLASLRAGFGIPNYIEHVWDQYLRMDLAANPAEDPTALMSDNVYYNLVPLMLGARGATAVGDFHQRYLSKARPDSLSMRLVSRTVGSDRIVDEVGLAFQHTEEVPWLLPGVPPTGMRVEIMIITFAVIHGGEICHVHSYWDQASVLAQVGLLDPTGLPVHGAWSTAKVLDETFPFVDEDA